MGCFDAKLYQTYPFLAVAGTYTSDNFVVLRNGFEAFNIHQKQKGYMVHHDRACFDMFKRVADFKTANAADFLVTPKTVTPAITKATTLFDNLNEVIANLASATSNQISGDAKAGTASKATQRESLLMTMRGIRKSAAAIATAQDDHAILEKFPVTDGHNETELIALANAYASAVTPLQNSFFELGHDANFIQNLSNQVAAFKTADDSQNLGGQKRSGATSSIHPLVEEGLAITKQLDAIMHNWYVSDANKTGQWMTASHIERRPAAKTTPAPAPQPQPATA